MILCRPCILKQVQKSPKNGSEFFTHASQGCDFVVLMLGPDPWIWALGCYTALLQPEIASRQCPVSRDLPQDGKVWEMCKTHTECTQLAVLAGRTTLISLQKQCSTVMEAASGYPRCPQGQWQSWRGKRFLQELPTAEPVWGGHLAGWWWPGSHFSWKICFTNISSSLVVSLFGVSI